MHLPFFSPKRLCAVGQPQLEILEGALIIFCGKSQGHHWEVPDIITYTVCVAPSSDMPAGLLKVVV